MNVRESCTEVRLRRVQETQSEGGAFFKDSISFHPKAQAVIPPPPFPSSVCLPPSHPAPPVSTPGMIRLPLNKVTNRLGLHTRSRSFRIEGVDPAAAPTSSRAGGRVQWALRVRHSHDAGQIIHSNPCFIHPQWQLVSRHLSPQTKR